MHIDFDETEHYFKFIKSGIQMCLSTWAEKLQRSERCPAFSLEGPPGLAGSLPRGEREDALGRHSSPYLSAQCQEPNRAKPLYLGVILHHQMERSLISSPAPVPYLPPPPPRLSH